MQEATVLRAQDTSWEPRAEWRPWTVRRGPCHRCGHGPYSADGGPELGGDQGLGSRGAGLKIGRASLLDPYRISPELVLNLSSCIICFSINSWPYHRQSSDFFWRTKGWMVPLGNSMGCSCYGEGWRWTRNVTFFIPIEISPLDFLPSSCS